MLEFNEYVEVKEDIEKMDRMLTNELIVMCHYYDISEDDQTEATTVTIYDETQQALDSVVVEDADVAREYLNTYFDLEETDQD